MTLFYYCYCHMLFLATHFTYLFSFSGILPLIIMSISIPQSGIHLHSICDLKLFSITKNMKPNSAMVYMTSFPILYFKTRDLLEISFYLHIVLLGKLKQQFSAVLWSFKKIHILCLPTFEMLKNKICFHFPI